MIKAAISTKYRFVLSNEQVFQNIDSIKLEQYDKFVSHINIGKDILTFAKNNQPEKIELLTEKYPIQVQLLKMEIQDSFICAFNLRNQQTIQYFLENGLQIQKVLQDSVLSVCYTLEYLSKNNAPIELLELILSYGANPRYANQSDSDTAIHLASSYGNLQFVKLLELYGADINAVNDEKKTPLNLATEHKRWEVVEYLKNKHASSKWNQ